MSLENAQIICNRRVVLDVFHEMQKVIDRSSIPIAMELNRSMELKAHPHTTFFRKSIPVVDNNGFSSNQIIVMRTIDIIKNVDAEDRAENLETLEEIIKNSLFYQFSIQRLLMLEKYIENAVDKFNNIHIEYDKLLKIYQNINSNSEGDKKEKKETMEKITLTQTSLEEQKEIIQKFINQIPYYVNRVREENDFVNIYMVDDSNDIHKFLTGIYAKNLIQTFGSNSLKKSYAMLKHNWSDFNKEIKV